MSRDSIRLRQSLGVTFGIAVAVGSMIGAGILRAPAEVASRLPHPLLFLGIWVLGGAYALLGANALAELGTMIPRSGGQLVFAKRAFGPYAGFVVGWNDWLSTCASIAAVALVAAESLRRLVPVAPSAPTIALMLVALLSVMLWSGVRASDRVQRVTSLAKALGLLALVVACAFYFGRHPSPAAATVAIPSGTVLLAAIVIALQGVIFAFDGWTGVIYFSEEVRDVGRDIPRALFGGVLSALALYLLLNAAFLGVLSLGELAGSSLAAAAVATRVFGSIGGSMVDLLIVLALPSAIVANLLMASRSSFALAREGDAPAHLAHVNAGGMPATALTVGGVVSALFLLTGTFEQVIAICAFLFVASYALSFAALFVLRAREPHAPRPYRARGHPVTTGLALALSLAFLIGVIIADRRNGLLALALVVVSWPVYRAIRRRKQLDSLTA